MNAWLLLVFGSQLIQALVILIDKFLVSEKQMRYPVVYAFYASVMSGFVFLLAPFLKGLTMPSLEVVALCIASSITYIIAIWSLYTIFKGGSTIETMPLVSAVTAVMTILLSVVVFGDTLSSTFFIGSVFLVTGSFLIARYATSHVGILLVFVSGASFALSTILVKEIFIYSDFVNGFFWSRVANVLCAFLLLLVPNALKAIRQTNSVVRTETAGLVLLNKVLAGVAFLMFLTALDEGNPSVVNAMQGLQFAFLFMFAMFFSAHIPEYFKHELEHRGVKRDMLAVALIIIGVGVLFI